MRKAGMVLFVILVVASSTWAQSTDGLTAEQLQEYNRLRLVVDVQHSTSGSVSRGVVSLSSSRSWGAYQGFRRITESEFYQIAGYDSEAAYSARRRKTGVTISAISWSVYLAGMGWMLSSLFVESDSSVSALWGGLGISLAASIPIGIGVRMMKKWTTVDQAQSVAEDYNWRLAEQIIRR